MTKRAFIVGYKYTLKNVPFLLRNGQGMLSFVFNVVDREMDGTAKNVLGSHAIKSS